MVCMLGIALASRDESTTVSEIRGVSAPRDGSRGAEQGERRGGARQHDLRDWVCPLIEKEEWLRYRATHRFRARLYWSDVISG